MHAGNLGSSKEAASSSRCRWFCAQELGFHEFGTLVLLLQPTEYRVRLRAFVDRAEPSAIVLKASGQECACLPHEHDRDLLGSCG